jgi:hypothetical protein
LGRLVINSFQDFLTKDALALMDNIHGIMIITRQFAALTLIVMQQLKVLYINALLITIQIME